MTIEPTPTFSPQASLYLERELEHCTRIVSGFKRSEPKDSKLRTLYGIPEGREALYCESGTLVENFVSFGFGRTLVIPVVPYPTSGELEANVASLDTLIMETLETGRVLPIIQHPGYYDGLEHFTPLLRDVMPPCYFVRGQFAYAIAFDEPIDLVPSPMGNPVLRRMNDLMMRAETDFEAALDFAVQEDTCWEHRWKNQHRRDDAFYSQLRSSLRYRYASVAFCIGTQATDALLRLLPLQEAWRLLLHIHILFDHVLCHGFGSDYAVPAVSAEGLDFRATRLREPKEFRRSLNSFAATLPTTLTTEVEAAIEEEHFLISVAPDEFTPESLRELSYNIDMAIRRFTDRTQKLTASQETVKKTFEVSFVVAGALQAVSGLEWSGSATVVSGIDKITGLPRWLAERVFDALRKAHRQKLSTWIVHQAEGGRQYRPQ